MIVNPDFRPPKKNDIRAWKLAEKIFTTDDKVPVNRVDLCEDDGCIFGIEHKLDIYGRDIEMAFQNKDKDALWLLWNKGVCSKRNKRFAKVFKRYGKTQKNQ